MFLIRSNSCVALTLVLFPQVGFAPPYHFTENVTAVWGLDSTGILFGLWDRYPWLYRVRLPLVAAWIIGFALQGQIRAHVFGFPSIVPLMPMTSAAFIVFTLYMIPDPG